MKKIDPRSPGQSSDCDDFKNPNGTAGGPGTGMGREDDGTFSNHSFSRGGESDDGDRMVEKYRPGKSGGGDRSSDSIPVTYDTNDDSD